jgi:hypothetical protein
VLINQFDDTTNVFEKNMKSLLFGLQMLNKIDEDKKEN